MTLQTDPWIRVRCPWCHQSATQPKCPSCRGRGTLVLPPTPLEALIGRSIEKEKLERSNPGD